MTRTTTRTTMRTTPSGRAGGVWTTAALPALLALAPVGSARAQAELPARGAALAARVAAVGDGTVRLTYALREGVCGDGGSVRVRERERDRDRSRDVEWDRSCEPGPGRLVLEVEGGAVRALRFHVGGRWRAADARTVELGEVPPDHAAGLLLRLARGDAPRTADRAAREALFPATLAAGVNPWPALLTLARDAGRPREVRRQAVFWLGVGAGDAATAGLGELVDDPDREVRVQAVFALSRRPDGEGIAPLIRIARTHRDPEVRRQALFWLGRSDDPRALALFEELLVGSGR
mgnify:CR=1 FL=1